MTSERITQHLEHIARTPVSVLPIPGSHVFHMNLPCGIITSAEPDHHKSNMLYLHNIQIGRPELRQKGIGTRLLQATVRYGLEQDPELQGIRAVGTNLALAKTFVRAFGEDAVRVDLTRHKSYGSEQKHSTAELFGTVAPDKLQFTRIWEVRACIDREKAKEWPLPVIKKH